MEFRELTDEGWELVRPLLPPRAKTSRPRIDDRIIINGILYVLVTGCHWMDMPIKYGSYKTAWDMFKRWSIKSVWTNIFKALIDKGHPIGKISLDKFAIDSTTIKARKGWSL